MANAMLQIFESDVDIDVIEIREGEKMYEAQVTREELMKAEEYDEYLRVRNLGEIDYDNFFTEDK